MEQSQRSLYGDLPACCRDWRLDEQSDETVWASAEFEFPDSYPGFDGHFPGRPVLPAVVQLAMVRYLSECVLGGPLLPIQYGKAKFKSVVQPGDSVTVFVELIKGTKGWSGSFKLERFGHGLVATGSVEYSLQTTKG